MLSFKRRKRFHERLFQSLILSASLILSPCANSRVFAEGPIPLTADKITIDPDSYTYSGNQIKPGDPSQVGSSVQVDKPQGGEKLIPDTDYSLSYANNVNAGNGQVIVTPKDSSGYTTDPASKNFTINQLDLKGKNPKISLTGSDSDYVYTGKPIEPEFEINYAPENSSGPPNVVNPMTHGTSNAPAKPNYTVSYLDNINAGIAKVTVTFDNENGNYKYTGTLQQDFTIKPATLTSDNVKLEYLSHEYNGQELTPNVTVTKDGKELTEGDDKDYTVSYQNNKEVGNATVTVTPRGNYTSDNRQPIKKTFSITKAKQDISKGTEVTLDKESYEYTGEAIEPTVTVTSGGVKLEKDKDYQLSYNENTSVGKGTVKVTGIGDYEGSSTEKSFEITPVDISASAKTNVSLDKSSYKYIGTAIKPKVTVTYDSKPLIEDTDYSVNCIDNTDVSRDKDGALEPKATAIITGKGNYTGTIRKTFTISPASVELTNLKASDIVYGQELSNSEITGKARTSDGTEIEGTFSFLNESVRTSDVIEEPSLDTSYEDYVVFNSKDGNYFQTSDKKVPVKLKYWGTVNVSNGKRFFVDAVGRTSAIIKDTDDIVWLKEDSDNSFAWYGLKNPKTKDGTRLFKPGSRFSVRWFNPNDFRTDANSTSDEKFDADPDLKDLDSQYRDDFLNGNLWLFQIEVTDPDGNKYENFYEKYGVEASVYVQLGTDWEDIKAIESLFVAVGKDDNGITAKKINSSAIEGSPTNGEFAELILKHFSIYGVGHSITYDDLYGTSSGTSSKSSTSTKSNSGSTSGLSSGYSYSSPCYTSGSSSYYKNDGDDYAMEMYLMSAFLPTVLLVVVYRKKKRLYENV